MRKSATGVLALVLATAATACAKDDIPNVPSQTKVVVIGVGAPFTGPSAGPPGKSLGNEIALASAAAADQINSDGGIPGGPRKGSQIDVRTFDDFNDTNKALQNIRGVVKDDRVMAFLGGPLADVSAAAAPVASRADFSYLSVSSSPKILQSGGASRSVFVLAPPSSAYAFAATEELLKAGKRRPAIVRLGGDFGDSLNDAVLAHLRDKGVSPVANETFALGDTDVGGQLGRIKGANPDSLVMVASPISASLVVKTADRLGLKVPVYDAAGAADDDVFLSDAGPLANGVVGATGADPDRATPAARSMRDAYRKAVPGAGISDTAAFGYEAVRAISVALADGATGRGDLADHLHRISIPDTGVGPLRFSPDGSRMTPRIYAYTVKDGRPSVSAAYEQNGPTSFRPVPLEH